MRIIYYSLGRDIQQRISKLASDTETISCTSLQRLQMLQLSSDDIIIMHSETAGKESIWEIINNKARPIIILSENARLLPQWSASELLTEDFTDQDILNAIENISTTDVIDTILQRTLIGSSEVMRKTREQLKHAIHSDLPVHIIGETGTGKTLAASLIHRLGDKNGKFIVESCGCLTTSIIDSELFGHYKGSFTGAMENREGLLSAADGATLFLDEIQDLPVGIQKKLLRVLDTGEYRKLGSDRILRTSFRLITASNIPLSTLLAEKRIRKDFYYRISGIEIRMPSLDEHSEDIPELLDAYQKKSINAERAINDFSLFMHRFPGNVRELFTEADLYMQGF